MIQYIYGRNGTGKLSYIINNIKEKSKIKNSIIIIPSLETLNVEGKIAQENLSGMAEIATFPLLCKMIFNETGGNNRKKISTSAKKVLMYSILIKENKNLKIYGNISKNDVGSIDKMLALHKEFTSNNISYKELKKASELIGNNNEHLKDKLADFAQIFEEYETKIDERWIDGEKDKIRASKKENDVFKGKDVYIYGFTSIEPDELALLENIIAQCDNIYVSISYDYEKDNNSIEFVSQKVIKNNIDKIISKIEQEKGIKVETLPNVLLTENVKYKSKELSFLSQNIFAPSIEEKYPYECEDVNVYRCSTKIEETYLAGYDICSKMYESKIDHNELTYGNIAVVCQNIVDYESPIKQVFEKLNIPYYLVDQTEIKKDPIISFINISFDCLARNFSGEDVIKLVKNGYTDFPEIEKDQFEKYVYKWDINGYTKFSKEWKNNPFGYENGDEEYINEVLKNVNKIREHIFATLSPLFITYSKKETIYEQSKKMYSYLIRNNIPSIVIDKANKMYNDSYNDANRLYSLWKNICNCMDELVDTLGEDWECTFEEYVQMLKLALSEYHLQPDETTMDRVIVGSINVIRPYNVKNLYVLGVNDGVFPKDVKESKFLSDKEKRYLVDNSILDLTNLTEKRRNDEIHLFYKTLCIPSNKLTITYTHYREEDMIKTKSFALTRVEDMFENFKEKFYRNLDEEKIWRREQAVECLNECSEKTKQALLEAYKEDNNEQLLCLPTKDGSSLRITDYTIDSNLLKDLFSSKDIYMSYSKIETYLKCEFKYFCDTFVGLYDDEKADFGENNRGSILHKILECSVNKIYELKKNQNLDDDNVFDGEIVPLIDQTTKEYLDSIHYIDYDDGKFNIMLDQIKKAAYRILLSSRKTLKNSSFSPTYYELHITSSNSKDIHTKPLTIEDDNSRVILSGYVDRVDIYKKDDKEYVKIIDYKSSDKTIDLKTVVKGVNTQMLLYLYSICENGIYDKRAKIIDEKTLIPAGVVYLTTSSNIEKFGKDESKKSNTLVLDKSDIIKEFENEELSTKERFTLDEGKENSFETIKADIRKLVLNTVDNIKEGKASTFYKKDDPILNKAPCRFCNYKLVCRNAQQQNF